MNKRKFYELGWYLAYPVSFRNLKEILAELGVSTDHTNIYRWVRKFTPQHGSYNANARKVPWQQLENGRGLQAGQKALKCLYRAVDKTTAEWGKYGRCERIRFS
jgi:putative transposase